MTDPVEIFLNEQKPMLKMVDEILDAWNGEGCYQVPTLVKTLAVNLNWNSDQARLNDPIIRAYLKNHPTWYVRRGANGGIMKRSEYQEKEAAKVAKEKAKQELKAKVALLTAAPVVAVQDNTDNSAN